MDLDADGHPDILSGSYSRMEQQPMAGTFQLLRGAADGTFKPAETVNGTDGQPLIIPAKGEQDTIESICTRPTAVDWDSDGDLDLAVGNFAGKFYWFAGEGGGKFAPAAQVIKAGDEPLKLKGEHSAHSDPFLIDWDGDGDLDLLSGAAAGGVQWAENSAGARKAPLLKPFADLIAAPQDIGDRRPSEVIEPLGSTRVWAADVNGDGKLDILVGDSVNQVSPAEGVSEADFTKRRAEWKEKFDALLGEMPLAVNEAKREALDDQMAALHADRSKFMSEERTGFVWVFIRK